MILWLLCWFGSWVGSLSGRGLDFFAGEGVGSCLGWIRGLVVLLVSLGGDQP